MDDSPAEAFAWEVWAYGSNDHVWEAIFDPMRSKFIEDYRDAELDFIEVAGELLSKIERTPDFTVGDLTHDEVVAAIVRRYPLLGPPPHHFD